MPHAVGLQLKIRLVALPQRMWHVGFAGPAHMLEVASFRTLLTESVHSVRSAQKMRNAPKTLVHQLITLDSISGETLLFSCYGSTSIPPSVQSSGHLPKYVRLQST